MARRVPWMVSGLMVALLGAALAWGSQNDPAPTTGPAVEPPEIILASQKPPEYPPAALAGRIDGNVTVEASILADGTVGDIKIINCSRKNLGFEQAAMDAVKQWRFRPASQAGESVDFGMKFRLRFNSSGPGLRDEPYVAAGAITSVDSDSKPRAAGARSRPSGSTRSGGSGRKP